MLVINRFIKIYSRTWFQDTMVGEKTLTNGTRQPSFMILNNYKILQKFLQNYDCASLKDLIKDYITAVKWNYRNKLTFNF